MHMKKMKKRRKIHRFVLKIAENKENNDRASESIHPTHEA